MTLGKRLSETAALYPNRVALVFGGRKYNYKELTEMADGLAGGLAALGLGPGGKAAILLPNCPEYAVSFFGIVRTGAAAVPLNTLLAPSEIDYILKDSGAGVLVFSSTLRDKVRELKSVPARLIVVGDAVEGALPFQELLKSPSPTSPPLKGGGKIRGRGPNPEGGGQGGGDIAPDADDSPAAIFYTSGTTGYPKGATLTHRNLISNADACAEMFNVTKADRFLLFLPMFHSFSFLVCVLLPLTHGARAIVLTSVRPFSNVIKAVVFGRATFFVAVPAVYNLLSLKKFPRLILRLLPLRICVSGAAPMPLETLIRFADNYPFPLLEGYGLTEASPVVSCNPISGKRKPGSVGLPIPGVQVRVVDESGNELPANTVGEITVKGPNVMMGYLGRKQATLEAIKDGWLFTGDMGYIDEEGYIFIVDRKKDLILMHGMNVYPREVEEALHQHPAVKEAAVIGVKDPHHGEAPKAYIVLKDAADPTEKEIKEFLRERLAPYKVPKQIRFVDSLPMSATGKVLKRELRDTR